MSCKITFAEGEDGAGGLKGAGRHSLGGQQSGGWQRPGGPEVLRAVEGVLMNNGPWFLTYNSAAGQMSKSTPDLSLLGSSNTGEDDGVTPDLKPRRLHRSTRNRSPETKHYQQEEEEVGTCEDSRLVGMSPGVLGGPATETSRTGGAGHGEGPVDALLEGLTTELVSRILADVEDISVMNITEAELLSFARSELVAMAADAEDLAPDWASPTASTTATGSRGPETARDARQDARQVKFSDAKASAAPHAAAARRPRVPANRTPTPVPEAKAAGARQVLYSATPAELEEAEAAAPQAPRRVGVKAAARGARASAEGAADRPGAPEEAAAAARASHGFADARLGPGGAYAVPAPERTARPAVTPRSGLDAGEARRPLSPHAAQLGTAGRGPRPTTPHRARQVQDPRLAAPSELSFGGALGNAAREGGDASQSPRQERRPLGAGQTPLQRRSAPSLQAPLGQGTATPRSSARAAAVAAGHDPRLGAPAPRRASQLSPARAAASHASRAGLHKSMSPSRSGLAARRVHSPRQAAEHYHDLSPGPATRLAAESGYLVADERDMGASRSSLRSRGPQDAEANDGMQAQPRTIGSTPRATHSMPLGASKSMAAAVNKVQQARVRKAGASVRMGTDPEAAVAAATAAGLPGAVTAGSRGYNLQGIAVGDEVGGIVTHTSWVGPFVNIGAEVDGFVDPITLPDKLTLNPGDLICGLRVELVDVEKPKLLLDGKNAWIMKIASGSGKPAG